MTNAAGRENLNPFSEQLRAAQNMQVVGRWQDADGVLTSFLEQVGNAEITALNQRGVVRRMLRNNGLSITDFTQARSLAREAGNQEAELTAVVGLIDAWRTADRDPSTAYPDDIISPDTRRQYLYQRSEVFVPEAQSLINQMPPMNLAIVNAYTNFGLLYDNMGNPQRALEYYSQAEVAIRQLVETSFTDTDFQNRLARTLTTKGVAQENAGFLQEALESQDEALQIYDKLDDLRGKGNSRISKADILRKLGRFGEARSLYEQAIGGTQREGEIVDQDIYDLAASKLESL